jgi:hypothetical protein
MGAQAPGESARFGCVRGLRCCRFIQVQREGPTEKGLCARMRAQRFAGCSAPRHARGTGMPRSTAARRAGRQRRRI